MPKYLEARNNILNFSTEFEIFFCTSLPLDSVELPVPHFWSQRSIIAPVNRFSSFFHIVADLEGGLCNALTESCSQFVSLVTVGMVYCKQRIYGL